MAYVLSNSSGGIQTFAWASKPASWPTNNIVYMSDVGNSGSFWRYDVAHTRWKPLNGKVLLASVDTTSSNITNASETIPFQYQIPAAVWQTGDILRCDVFATKSGTTSAFTATIRIGSAGTTSDTSVESHTTHISGAQQQGASTYRYRLDSATTVRPMHDGGVATGAVWYAGSTVALVTATTITASAATTALFFDLGAQMSSATDTGNLVMAQLWLESAA